jgi:hypothetical protein
VIIFANDKRFMLVDVGQKGLEENIILHRNGEVSSTVIPTIYGTHFRGLRIVLCCVFYLKYSRKEKSKCKIVGGVSVPTGPLGSGGVDTGCFAR